MRSMALSGRYLSLMYCSEKRAEACSASSVYLSPWNCSYRPDSPLRISIVSSMDGSSTITGWKRRSRAASLSKCFLYSSSVVAPIHWNSPRARAGLSKLAASRAPSPAPAPMSVWISSMTSTMLPAFLTSSMIFLSRSSNSPLYLVPATSSPMSSTHTRLFSSIDGTSRLAIRCASPSAMAVLPTPGSPISTGLDLVRRARICTTRSISFWRPTTGSSCDLAAFSVRSMENSLSVGVDRPLSEGPPTVANSSASLSIFMTSALIFSLSRPIDCSTLDMLPSSSLSTPSSRCSVSM
mmetsp:Transcript_35842/g.89286  ORF Transcript_35842/g.89286 Transcript_35842/m.89286 type:complete len:295 (+) Transcript_35842:594-1478(+)